MSHPSQTIRGGSRLSLWGIVLIALVAPLLSGCAGAPVKPTPPLAPISLPWTYADLRLIDPSDAPHPEYDLLAVYLRRSGPRPETRWEIRLDFLDMSIRNRADLYLALDFTRSGSNQLPFPATAALDWDLLIHIPPSAPVSSLSPEGSAPADLSLLVQRDPAQASLVLSLDGAALYPLPGSAAPPEIALQVFLVSPETSQVLDQTVPVRSSDQPPPPANLLLAFNNTFPAYTPAQALRRWDGAHTGPAGGRHGLANLLRLARNREIPLALLDLKYPPWLSALEFADGVEQVIASLDAGLLILPDVIPPVKSSGPISIFSHKIAEGFGLLSSHYGYANFIPDDNSFHKLLFIPIHAESPFTHIYRQGSQRILPVPLSVAANPDLHPDPNGLSLPIRRLLVQAALDAAREPASAPILVLGGDLTRSSWGIPEVARAAFAYIQNHPWIRPLGAYDLLSLPVASPLPELQPLYPHPPEAIASLPWETLFASQPDPLLAAARHSALVLIPPAPPAIPEFAALQEIHSRQIYILLAARRWASQPQSVAACEMDLDLDRDLECLLASENLYLVFEPDLGALTHAFWLASDGPHQFIAPSSQFSFGASDPAAWDLSADLAADPAVIPGAFYDGAVAYQAQVSPGALSMTDPDSGLSKRFSLLPDGVRVAYDTASPLMARLPLALDPWMRFAPGWGVLYNGESTEEGWQWGILPASEQGIGVQVRVTTNGHFQVNAFADAHRLMGITENPNAEFPPGHYLPFPVALGEISADGDFWLEISLSPK